MKYYLSSYKVGNYKAVLYLKKMALTSKKLAYIPNALDFSNDPKRRKISENEDIQQLKEMGFQVERLDLREYFKKEEKLEKRLNNFGVVWVRGGNVFVLRQAMKLSGFDKIIKRFKDKEFLYGGYSSGICVLAPSLRGLELVDDNSLLPYPQIQSVVWKGLGLIYFMVLPHYKSNHPESHLIDKVVKFYKERNIPFELLKDGEVLVSEKARFFKVG